MRTMKTNTLWLAYLFCLPFDLLISWPLILFVRAAWGKSLRWERRPVVGGPVLVCDIRADSWPARTWYKTWGGTTVGHGIFYGHDLVVPGEWSSLQEHEHVHVEQFEGVSISSFLTALWVTILIVSLGHTTVAMITGLAIWMLGYLMMGIGNYGAALFRGESMYRGSSHEESAYAQGDAYRNRNGH